VTSHAKAEISFVEHFLAPRWKAIAAFAAHLVLALIGLGVAHDLDAATAWGAFGTALVTGGIVHQVPDTRSGIIADLQEALAKALASAPGGSGEPTPAAATVTDSGATVVPATPTPAVVPSSTATDDDTPGA